MSPDAALNLIATVLYKDLISQGVPPNIATTRVGMIIGRAFKCEGEK